MKNEFYIYKCFFQKKSYIQLDIKPKYILILLYSMSDENGQVTIQKIELAKILNMSKQSLNFALKKLEINNFISRENPKIIKVNRPTNKDKIPMNKSLIFGEYNKLSYGAQILYTYYQNLQEKENKEYLKIPGEKIVETIGKSIKSIQIYYKELEAVGLLKKGREAQTNTLSFKKKIGRAHV